MSNKINVHVREGESSYTVSISNSSDSPAMMTIDFGQSENLQLLPKAGQKVSALLMEYNAPAGSQSVEVAVLEVVNRQAGVRFHYKTSMKQLAQASAASKPSQDDDEVTKVAEGLELIVRSVESGYALFARNTNKSTAFDLVVDLSKSSNLVVIADQDNAKFLDTYVLSSFVPAGAGFGPLADCQVRDPAQGGCEIQYQVRARGMQ